MRVVVQRLSAGQRALADPLRQPQRRLAPQRCATVASAATKFQPPPGLAIVKWTGDGTQVKALDSLRAAMAATPYGGRVDEDTLRWFLLDRKLDVEDAVGKLSKMMRWREEFGADALTFTDIAKEAATGKAYLHAHLDNAARPVIIVRCAKHLTNASPLMESQRLCVHICDRAVERLSPEQQTMLGIFDLRGFTSRNADLGFVRFLVDIFFTYYPKRLSQVLFVEAPWAFKPGWEMIKPLLKKYAALVRFVTVEELRREYFTPETVPEEFRGEGFPKA